MEIWDAYNKYGEKVEMELIRGEVIPKGIYHLVVEILIQHIDGTFLAMQRDYNKDGYPGKFELSAGGAALKDETASVAILRELKEETGITSLIQLTKIGNCFSGDVLFYNFIGITDCDKSSIKLQAGETISYAWYTKDELTDFINSDMAIKAQYNRIKNFLYVKK